MNSIEWMTPCSLVPQFLTALDWILIYSVLCSSMFIRAHPSLQGFKLVHPNEHNPSKDWRIHEIELAWIDSGGTAWLALVCPAGLKTLFSKDAGIWSLCSKMFTRSRMCLVLVGEMFRWYCSYWSKKMPNSACWYVFEPWECGMT